jgi:hypothetical protein
MVIDVEILQTRPHCRYRDCHYYGCGWPARRDQVLGLMLADGLRPALVGLLLGLITSDATTRFIKAMLYQTQPLDLEIFAAVAGLLIASAVPACLVPAWRLAVGPNAGFEN